MTRSLPPVGDLWLCHFRGSLFCLWCPFVCCLLGRCPSLSVVPVCRSVGCCWPTVLFLSNLCTSLSVCAPRCFLSFLAFGWVFNIFPISHGSRQQFGSARGTDGVDHKVILGRQLKVFGIIFRQSLRRHRRLCLPMCVCRADWPCLVPR